MEFVIIDRNERQWLAALESNQGGSVPAKYNNFFVRKKMIEKDFNGKKLTRDEWVIIVDTLEDLISLRELAPNGCFNLGDVWGYPAIIV